MFNSRPVFVAAFVLAALFGQSAFAQPPGPKRTPLELAQAVERRAGDTDFAALEAFGRQAERRTDREGLQRLYHVAWILLNQGEFERAAAWNDSWPARPSFRTTAATSRSRA